MIHRLSEIGHRENTGIIPLDFRFQILPDLAVRLADIDMAAPDPFAFTVGTEVIEYRRLRVVDYHEIGRLQHRP